MSSRSNKIIIGETTIFPCITGLLELLAILFTPVAIMRRDIYGARYSGAICGLGYDLDSKNGLLPTNDIEIVFPFVFDNSDLETVHVNVIRSYISNTLGGNLDSSSTSQRYINLCQEAAVNKIIEYINKPRLLKYTSPSVSYSW
ncbi:hypothetical protein MXB_28, partial [Myxobolus squamalis]